jgi:hypothetical protein
MRSTKQTKRKSIKSNQNLAGVAGLAYVLVITIGVLKVNFIEPIILSYDTMEWGSNILANERLFRIGITCEILMYLLVLVISIALYAILKPISNYLALAALCFRFGEAFIGTVSIILSGLIPLILLNKEAAPSDLHLQLLIETFIDTRITALNLVLIFIGVGGTIFCYLFYISSMIPRVLAVWGLATYISMYILGFSNILFPAPFDLLESVLFSAGALFELVFGIWLLIKGVSRNTESKTIA